MGSARSITIAAGQIPARPMNQADLTLASLDSAIEEAHRHKVDLLVLPECAYPAYLLGSIESYRAGRHMAGESFVRWLAGRAAHYRMHIVSGFVDDSGNKLYNAAVLLDDDGREIGRAHKTFLWDLEHDWYAAGEQVRALDTRLGRIGMIICAETRAPEILATLAADGAELLAMPTCWVNSSRQAGEFRNPQVEFLIEARAREFALPIVCADKSGVERDGFGYVGKSRIVQADGSLVVEAAPTGEAVICAQITPARSHWQADQRQHVARLLSHAPPIRPRACDLSPIRVAAIPAGILPEMLDADGPLLCHLREHKPRLLVALAANADDAPRLRQRAANLAIDLLLAPRASKVLDLAGGHAACLVDSAARSFVTPRRMVLDGATMLVFWEEPSDLSVLRTRALENRVFVIAANSSFAAIIGPDGAILSCASAESRTPATAVIALGEAADKSIAPQTDLLVERRPATYRF
ncbi:MAG: nitrilase-related carbon-nitrogen hydrolase [Phycisphaerae bacterium]|nr:nitrilase-related carbon-nitrogen hydrolase [Phycisphaerae bacterium]